MLSREFHADLLIGDTSLVVSNERASLFDTAAKHLADAGLDGSIIVESVIADPNSKIVQMNLGDAAAVQGLLGVLGNPQTPVIHPYSASGEPKTTIAA